MGKNEFLDALRRELYGLPPNEIERSISFYAEMIDDRIEDGMSEEDAVRAMEDVGVIAQRIKLDQPLSTLVRSKVKTSAAPGALSLILIILGFPVWFPLLCAFLVIVLAVLIVIVSLIISLFAMVLGFCLGGISAVVGGLIHVFISPISGIAVLGAGLALAGIGALLFFPAVYGAKFLLALAKIFGRWIKSLFIGKRPQYS